MFTKESINKIISNLGEPEKLNHADKMLLGISNLLLGNFETGWKYFEHRDGCIIPDFVKTTNIPAWNGESLEDKTIFVYFSDGYGDTLQFVRYLPILNAMGAKVLCFTQPELTDLLRQSDLKAKFSSDFPIADYHVSLMSLPYFLKARLDNIPFKSGYIKAPPEKVKYYKDNYFNNKKFKIGIVWQCRNLDDDGRFRTIHDISLINNLPKIEGIEIYSLQKSKGTLELDEQIKESGFIDIGQTFKDWTDTAAAVENMDLIICVDTSVGHLAGAMGKPTWFLLPCLPDWRWLLDTNKSYWYDSVKLFRQTEPYKWDDVINQVYTELKKITQQKLIA